jgi:hypothetical protein
MNWRLEIDNWPGPDRRKWPGLRDVIAESPDGRHVAVVYSCGEVGIAKEAGFFALLRGPAESPRVVLRPRGLMCFGWLGGNTVQWIGSRHCLVTPYRMGGTLYLDVEGRQAAHAPAVDACQSVTRLPDDLQWRSWHWLSPWLRFAWLVRRPS